MGAVLGIAAMGRTQEKLAGANNGGAGTGYVPPPPVTAAPAPTFSAPSFAPPPAPPAPVADEVKMVNGKKAPVQPSFPEI
jgi:hypothetical protein